MKFYITKYALTKGIYAVEGELVGTSMVRVQGAYPWQSTLFGKNDAWQNLEDAMRRADTMRSQKLVQIENEQVRLREMKFRVHYYPS